MFAALKRFRHRLKAELWRRRGSTPGASGSNAAKWLAIEKGVLARRGDYGYHDAGIDERVVEYPWIFERMSALDQSGQRVLDAGSILNHRQVLDRWRSANRSSLSIVTLAYEGSAHVATNVRYEFADLRHLPYRDEWFSVVLCISTLEHVGLDTTIYGSAGGKTADPNAEAVSAMRELLRVTVRGGTLLLSVPFGTRSNRNWLRVFDGQDLAHVVTHSGWTHVGSHFFRATKDGWREGTQDEARTAGYNEPRDRPGERSAPTFVAAAEAIALVELKRP